MPSVVTLPRYQTNYINNVKISSSNIHIHNFYCSLPGGHDEEVHEVPGVPHVAALVQHEAQRQDLGAHLRGEHHHEDDLQLFLKHGTHLAFTSKILKEMKLNILLSELIELIDLEDCTSIECLPKIVSHLKKTTLKVEFNFSERQTFVVFNFCFEMKIFR